LPNLCIGTSDTSDIPVLKIISVLVIIKYGGNHLSISWVWVSEFISPAHPYKLQYAIDDHLGAFFYWTRFIRQHYNLRSTILLWSICSGN